MTGIDACKGILNEESLVSASHHLALITSLSFVHTARRSYRLEEKVSLVDLFYREATQTYFSVGRRSRNKVIVGEPALGSSYNLNASLFCKLKNCLVRQFKRILRIDICSSTRYSYVTLG